MAGKTKRNELVEAFLDAWRRDECLWDVKKRSRRVSTLSWKNLT